jgi:chromosome partitioning protein
MPIVVSFVSQKGGVGKSTLARALLAVSAHMLKARLADLDPHQASVVAWERARGRNNAGSPCEVVAYATVGEAVAASGDVDLLILDTPAGTNRATLDIARHSHLIVQPTGASADDLVPAVLTFHELVKAGVPKQRLVAAICRVLSAGEEASVRAYMEEAGYEVLAGAIAERIAYREAQNRGQAITETKLAKLNRQADALIEALLDKVAGEIKRLKDRERRKPKEAS